MVEEIVVTGNLTPRMTQSAQTLITALDDSGTQVDAAYWLYNEENRSWTLTLASEEVLQSGPRRYYEKILTTLDRIKGNDFSLSLEDIRATSPRDQQVVELFALCDYQNPTNRKRISREYANSLYIDEALIYRMNLKKSRR